MALTWARARGWRLQRQLLDPVGTGSVVDVVERLGAVPAWPDATAELAIGARRDHGRFGDAMQALASGAVVKVFAFRGATHLMTPSDAGAYLALRASTRMWELPSWETYYGLAPSDWPRFREYIRRALAKGPLTRSELAASLGRSSRYRHLSSMVTEGNDTLLKPLTWQGDMGLGPARDGEATFVRLDQIAGWGGIPELEEAGPPVIETYLRVYGPTTPERVHDWFGNGLGAKRKAVARWLDELAEKVDEVEIEGDHVLVLRDDVPSLLDAEPSRAVRLLPGRDQWVMASGTSDARVVPTGRRAIISRSANPVIAGGVVAGTWTMRGERLEVVWFGESGRVAHRALEEQAEKLSTFTDRALRLTVAVD